MTKEKRTPRATVQGGRSSRPRRSEWRGEFDGVFLGERDGEWIAGRMFVGKSMHDGFGESGEWRYATCYDLPREHEVYRAHDALNEYIRLAKLAGDCWNCIFDQRAGEVIDRYWARRVPLDDVADMPALRVRPGLLGEGGIRSGSYMLPAVEAKYDLLKLMRGALSVREMFATRSSASPAWSYTRRTRPSSRRPAP
ncbi:hypothetical protein [Streptomyces aureocirculatus]|uniref:hypothetical protein n=1 Tax=Streptomyces aureocirculatus TaxID=67275 RepID=UPI0004C5B2BE|nr:hypothetical protein [Streptomyces aureocirculatus]